MSDCQINFERGSVKVGDLRIYFPIRIPKTLKHFYIAFTNFPLLSDLK